MQQGSSDHHKIVNRFLNKVEKTSSCWIWKAQIANGYGVFWLNGGEFAHRVSWKLFKGEIPEGLIVCHNCPGGDNKSCVNPDHLFLGTYKDNMQDMIKKGSQPIQEEKLNKAQQLLALELYESGVPQRKIAEKFNLSQRTIWRYIHKHIPSVPLIGENNNKSKLCNSDVLEIRKLYKPRIFSSRKLAKLYGVEKSTILRIINGETWTSI